jgi:sporulation protein YpjB
LNKNTRMLVFLIVVGLLLAWPIHAWVTKLDHPAEQEHLAELDKLAGEMLELTKQGDIEGAQQKIKLLADRFPNLTLPVTIRIESLNAVTQSILAAKKSFSSPKTNEEQLLWHATQVRVAIDALSHVHQPMWRSYYASYATQMQNLMQSSVERDINLFRTQFEENYRLYLAIKPGMSVQLPEEQMNQIGTAYDTISKEMRNSTMEWQVVREALRELSGIMQSAFIGEDKSAIAMLMLPGSPLMPIVTIVALLIVTLTYVGYRKYAGQQVRV